jgi:hypothetical protein
MPSDHHDWIDAVAILAPSAVAIAAIGSSVWQHVANLRAQRESGDLAEVRGALDDAVVLLHRIAYDLDDAKGKLTSDSMRSQSGTRLYESLKERGDAADTLLERLRLRFGRDHVVVQEFEKVDGAVLDFWRALGRLRMEPPSDGSPVAREAILRVTDEARATVNAQRQVFDADRAAFIDAAQKTAGTNL